MPDARQAVDYDQGGQLTRPSRLYFDVTFTRTQEVNVGITRTVRRLRSELERLAPARGFEMVPVVYSSSGFRSLVENRSEPDQRKRNATTIRSRVRDWVNTGPIRHFVSARFPLSLRWMAWSVFSWLEFNRLSRGMPAIEVMPGDVLFLCDASWSYRIWRATAAARRRGAKIANVVYDLIPIREPQYCTPLTVIALRDWVHRQLPLCDLLLCISRAVEEDLHAYAKETAMHLRASSNFRLGCDPAQKVHDGDLQQVRDCVRAFVNGGPCFTAIGSIEPRKNYGFVLDAFERLWGRQVDVRLLIVGRRDAQCPELLARIDGHFESGSRLLALYDGTDQEVAFAYADSRALLFPSLAEGFGLPLVEARACGCRVIASDLPAFAEIADEGVSLFSTNSLDQFERLVLQHMQHQEHVAPMRPYTWEDSARRCLELVGQLSLIDNGCPRQT